METALSGPFQMETGLCEPLHHDDLTIGISLTWQLALLKQMAKKVTESMIARQIHNLVLSNHKSDNLLHSLYSFDGQQNFRSSPHSRRGAVRTEYWEVGILGDSQKPVYHCTL